MLKSADNFASLNCLQIFSILTFQRFLSTFKTRRPQMDITCQCNPNREFREEFLRIRWEFLKEFRFIIIYFVPTSQEFSRIPWEFFENSLEIR